MRALPDQSRKWLASAALIGLTIAAAGAEHLGAFSSVRPWLLDLCSPGRLMVLALSPFETVEAPQKITSEASLPNSVAASSGSGSSARELLLRQLLIENARLRRDLQRERQRSGPLLPGVESSEMESRPPLMDLRVIPARVLTRQDEFPEVLRELAIDAGRAQGLNRAELVVQGAGRVIDAGREQRVQAGDRVLDGLTVVGRIDRSARWISLVQPVTAEAFRARVQLLRISEGERYPGATGLLEGTGTRECRLTGLGPTDAVAVGDEVVAAGVEGLAGPPLYFGRVVKADFLAGGKWDVAVAPAVQLDDLESVQVLRWEWLKTGASR
ncbi:MAG: rod shape-determining protein MreC [Planctomycetaceae bacterium]